MLLSFRERLTSYDQFDFLPKLLDLVDLKNKKSVAFVGDLGGNSGNRIRMTLCQPILTEILLTQLNYHAINMFKIDSSYH